MWGGGELKLTNSYQDFEGFALKSLGLNPCELIAIYGRQVQHDPVHSMIGIAVPVQFGC